MRKQPNVKLRMSSFGKGDRENFGFTGGDFPSKVHFSLFHRPP